MVERQTMKPLKAFISYSHLDEASRSELVKHMATLHREGVIETWYDRRIGVGSNWKSEIDKNLENADVVLLLVSPNFIHSNYCYEIEFKRAMERKEMGECLVIPILIEYADWQTSPLAHLQMLPRTGKPISQSRPKAKAFVAVCQELRQTFEQLGSASRNSKKHRDFSVLSEKFIPVFIGQEQATKYAPCKEVPRFADLKEHERYSICQNGGITAYKFPFGVSLLHCQEQLRFSSIAELAAERRRSYKNTLDSDCAGFVELCEALRLEATKGFRPNYALSLFTVLEPAWDSQRELEIALKLLAMPGLLISNSQKANGKSNEVLEKAKQIEDEFFKNGIESDEISDFGLKGISIGYASWAGVSYYVADSGRAIGSAQISSFEIQLQALWCYADAVQKQLVRFENTDAENLFGAKYIRSAYSQLIAVGGRDSMQLRRMKDAVSKTSHITRIVESALDVLK